MVIWLQLTNKKATFFFFLFNSNYFVCFLLNIFQHRTEWYFYIWCKWPEVISHNNYFTIQIDTIVTLIFFLSRCLSHGWWLTGESTARWKQWYLMPEWPANWTGFIQERPSEKPAHTMPSPTPHTVLQENTAHITGVSIVALLPPTLFSM